MDFEQDFVTLATGDIMVSACQSLFLEEEDHDEVCVYCLRIENNSDSKIQILGKNFNITDSRGNNYTKCGAGFKGEIPELEPGEYFEFEDVAPFKANTAVLYGTCRIKDEEHNKIKDIQIPVLELYANKPLSGILN